MKLSVPPSLFGFPVFYFKALRKYRKKAEGDVPEPPKPEATPEIKKPARVVPANYQPTPEEAEEHLQYPMPQEFRVGYQATPQVSPPSDTFPLTPEQEEAWRNEIGEVNRAEASRAVDESWNTWQEQQRTERDRTEQRFHAVFQNEYNQSFVQEIKANPTDPAARLVWADWLEEVANMPDYAEVIRLHQWMISEGEQFSQDQKNEMIDRINELCEEHPEWTGVWGWRNRHLGFSSFEGMASMDRGMLKIRGNVDTFFDRLHSGDLGVLHLQEEFEDPEAAAEARQMMENNISERMANVEQVTLDVNSYGHLTSLVQHNIDLLDMATVDWIDHISSLRLNCSGAGEISHFFMQHFLPHLGKLTNLEIEGYPFNPDALSLFVNSNRISNLRVLGLRDVELDARAVQTLVTSENLTRLQELDLSGNNIGEDGINALINSPYLRDIRTLSVSIDNIPQESIARLQQRFPADVLRLHENVPDVFEFDQP